jgi:hypothetical protein
MLASAEVARRIVAAPAPVLFVDTCALLDLMRDPTRGTFSAGDIEAALRLLERAERRNDNLWLPIAAQVLDELRDNQANVKLEAGEKIRRLEETIHHVQSILAAYGLQTTAIAPTLVSSNFPDTANRVVERYFSAGLKTRNPRNIEKKAYARMAANRAPSSKGQQTKDCAVIESYLSLARQLRAQNFSGRIVFFTTNKKDYSDIANRSLHPDLVPEFAAVNLTYATNFQMAEHQLV